jgi:molybdopterin-guanine dinucleotide biosynthesis adapter protein
MKRIIGVAGFKNSGKTTLVEKLVMHLTQQGYRVSTVKHAHHSFDIDHEGRDSFRHRKAGASEVAVISKERTAIIHELRGIEPPFLAEVLDKIQPCDLVIVEGYKRDRHDKIEVRNLTLNHPNLAGEDPTVVAIASTGPVTDAPVPVFNRDDVVALADFIIRHCELNRKWNFRRAVATDANAVRELTRRVYAKWISAIGREPFPMNADYDVAVVNHWIDLFEEDGKLLGLVEMIPRSDHLFIENLAVAESSQGRGIGALLLHHVEDLARAARLPEVQLSTNRAFAANVTFYQKRGYELYASTPLPDGGTMVRLRKRVS